MCSAPGEGGGEEDKKFVLKNWLQELLGRPRHMWEDDVTVGCNGF